ncbi:MAG: hypothetical protein IIU70_05715 [Anaerotignum sp.]|jgi:hypothetical protein|nr:hypothetical protein [Anaerotignum sp.]
MKCPFCQNEMSEGKMVSGRFVQWKTTDPETGKKQEYLLAKSFMGDAKLEGYLCPNCRKMILDIPDTLNSGR